MKEAPKRIYVCNNIFPNHVDWEGSPINTKRIDNNDIEYVRIDDFVEKACEYFRTKKKCVFACIGEDVYHSLLNEEEIEDFKTYMKGE